MTNPEIREQLSALIDNELDRDRARFLLKRAEHDGELVALWQRWHFVGEAMRGSALPLRKDFARSITQRLDEESDAAMPGASRRIHALRWGGGFAVAASVALVALLLVRPDVTTAPVSSSEGQIASQPVPVLDVTAPSVVAPSPYREQDLRPPYRFDAQTVAARDAGRYGVRFDPAHEAYWLRHQQAVNGRTGGVAEPWLAPLRPEAAEGAR